jgi:hypothetical protein
MCGIFLDEEKSQDALAHQFDHRRLITIPARIKPHSDCQRLPRNTSRKVPHNRLCAKTQMAMAEVTTALAPDGVTPPSG